MTHYRIFSSPLAGFRDSSTYEFVAEFTDPTLVDTFLRDNFGKNGFEKRNIIVKEVDSSAVDSKEGKVGCVLTVMGEYLPIDEYEFK